MNKKEFLVIGAIVIVLIGIIVVATGGNEEQPPIGTVDPSAANTVTDNTEFVQVQEDGTKVNTSSKLDETKTIDGLTVSGIVITEKNNLTEISATITNSTDSAKGGYEVSVKILDKQNSEITSLSAYIETVEPGQSAQFVTSATADLANAYDFTIEKK